MRLGDSVRAALRVRLIGNLVLLAVALAGTLAAVEVGLRAARLLRAQDRPLLPWEARDNEWTFYQYDSLLGWRNRPGGAGWFSMPDSRTYVQINSHGLRDGEHTFAKRRARVLVLGDSFTWGFGLEQDQRYSDWLATVLGPDVEVINGGVSGYGTDQELLFFQTEGFRYQPDVVLLEFELEDVTNNTHDAQYTYPKPYFVLQNGRLRLLNVPVPARQAPWQQRYSLDRALPPPATASWKARKFLRDHFLSYGFIVDGTRSLLAHRRGSETRDSVEAVTAALLLELKRQAELHGAELVIMMLPAKMGVLKKGDDAQWAAYSTFLQTHGIRHIDLLPLFRSESERGRQLYFAVDAHWNAAGHRAAARALCAYIAAAALVPRAAAVGPRCARVDALSP